MAQNFKMFISKRKGGWRDIELTGNFDGTSACELAIIINSLSKKSNKFKIKTANLNRIYRFGKEIWKNRKNSFPKNIKVTITGGKIE